MGETITQDNRLIAVTTNAGKDVLLLDTVTGVEAISRPYRVVLNLMSEVQSGNPAKVKPHDLVGTSMTVTIALTATGTGEDMGTRYITGFCERFTQSGADDEFAYFSATIVPWFSFLNYATNCRIFQDQAVPDIISAVVGAYGYGSMLRSELTKTYATRDYCVQYRETDFAFLSRLMEDEGIYYYFEHTDGNHVMVLADATSCYKDLPVQNKFKYAPVAGQDVTADAILQWSVEERIHPGKWTSRDYHHEAPDNRIERSEPSTSVASEGKKFEIFDYPGDDAKIFNKAGSFSSVPAEAEKTPRTRMEKEEAFQQIVSGVSKGRSFATGYKVDVEGGDAAGSYLLTNISHRVSQLPAYRNRDAARPGYENTFTGIPAAVPFVPQQVTARSVVYGLQTAFVIDESSSGNSEEIWPDKYGRVRVRFNWDREAKYACWVRVVQPWAGKAWGQQWIPRIGDEVAITFLEGDPDCPVVIGGVYNATNMPIFTLPDNKTQSGLLTHSSSGGGSSNYNMLRFEDKMGNEEIYVQAEKDWNSLVKNNETRTVKNDRTTTIHVNESRTVETGDDTIAVQQGNRTITVQQNIAVKSNNGNISTEASTGNISVKADMGNISETASMGNISTTANMGNISTTADMGNISNSASLGNITISASVGSISISGLSGVTISCGASSISMTPASISISAPMVMINS
jgi:type VI secretion system secreted protein VgrG